MADDPQPIQEPPYPPPTAVATAFMFTTASVTLIACGSASLLMSLLADCLNKLNLVLGLIQLLVGLAIFIWFLSWWLPTSRRGLRQYEAHLEYRRAELESLIEKQTASQSRSM